MPSFVQRARDPLSCYSHFIAAVASAIVTVVALLLFFRPESTLTAKISALVFCLSLVALYSTSAYYHYAHGSQQKLQWLRKLDHSMIYLLIAGSYTPMLLAFYPYPKAIYFTIGIWVIAVFGVAIKLCWLDAPRWLYTGLYILMGWVILIDIPALAAMPAGCIALLVAGGVSYTFGAVLYILKKPNFSPAFGFHEVFHLFVMLGSLFHVIAVFTYVL